MISPSNRRSVFAYHVVLCTATHLPVRPGRSASHQLMQRILRCCPRTWPAHDPGAMQRQANTFLTLHSAPFTPCTSHFTRALRTRHFISPQITWALLSSSHLIPSLLTCHQSKFFSTVFISSEHLSTFLISSKFVSTHLSCSARQKPLTVREKSLAQKTLGAESFCTQTLETQMHLDRKAFPKYLWYKACTKHFPVLLLLVLKKLAQSTSQYYFVLQSLHKALPSTTLYYKACTKHFPVLLCTTRLAQSTSQYYFALQSLHKVVPSTMYYKTCTKHVPVLLCTTELARSTSQYYFVLQSLHKVLPSTTLYYEACASTSQYYFVLQTLHKVCPRTTLYYNACTKKALTHSKFFRREGFTHSKLF